MKTPKGGDRRPTFYSRRFCRSVCRRTKSFRRSRTVKGNFAWGSYGGFSAGSWRVLGTFSAESRQDLGEISPPLAMRCLGGPKTAPREPKGSQRVPKGSPKSAKGSQKGGQREPRGRQNSSKNDKKSKKAKHFWLRFGSILGAKFNDFSCYFLASFFD